MKFAQILYNKAHWIFESDSVPDFAPNIKIVDISDTPEVQEGWDYDEVTGTFTAPQPVEDNSPESPSAEEKMKSLEKRVAESENALLILLDMGL